MIARVTVIGAGTMGHGIAHAAIMAGYETTMYDVAQEAIDKGCAAIAAIVDKGVELGKATAAEAALAKSRLRTTSNLGDAVKAAQFIVEAAPERIDLKLALLGDLDTLAPPSAILASNTSSLSITEM